MSERERTPDDLIPLALAVRLGAPPQRGRQRQRSTILRWITNGRLTGYRNAVGAWYVSRSEVLELVEPRPVGGPVLAYGSAPLPPEKLAERLAELRAGKAAPAAGRKPERKAAIREEGRAGGLSTLSALALACLCRRGRATALQVAEDLGLSSPPQAMQVVEDLLARGLAGPAERCAWQATAAGQALAAAGTDASAHNGKAVLS